MRSELLEILRCPYCGGSFDLVASLFHRTDGDEIRDGILGCQCCIFPVVDGIPVLHLQSNATDARDLVQAGRPEAALRCHRTQMGPNNPIAWIDESEARRWLGVEYFRRSPLESIDGSALEQLGEPLEV